MLELWWQGLPPGIRGQVWIRAIGNELNISKGRHAGRQQGVNLLLYMSCLELYEISLRRCNSRLSDISVGVTRDRSGCK